MFSNLTYQDKVDTGSVLLPLAPSPPRPLAPSHDLLGEAFFSLLDEYFASRPHLSGQVETQAKGKDKDKEQDRGRGRWMDKQAQSFGHVDTSSKMSAFTSMWKDPQKGATDTVRLPFPSVHLLLFPVPVFFFFFFLLLLRLFLLLLLLIPPHPSIPPQPFSVHLPTCTLSSLPPPSPSS
ncbi:hypothetical protein EHS25_008310 [Saitozyma podzolica]|uniref:Uncharacterized protein n=1 Tax=Saitozyma podzolica TaxID=1890683 RepID=A0A427YP20_9TREE|nr:hypothetical protein EHS25_008310 [Saitozyma podzolica]